MGTTEKDYENQELDKVLETDSPLKTMVVNYVGELLQPENMEVTLQMVIEVLASEFPDLIWPIAEENWMRGYQQGLNDNTQPGVEDMGDEGIDCSD